VIATLFIGAVVGIALSAVYAYIVFYDPFIYINALAILFFGALTGHVIAKGTHIFRIRSPFAAGLIGTVVFILAYTAHWFVYLSVIVTDSAFQPAMIIQNAFKLMRNLPLAWSVVCYIYENGVWSLRSGSNVSGYFLLVVWAAEALALFVSLIVSSVDKTRSPYSERQDKWIDQEILPQPITYIEDKDEFKRALANGDFSALTVKFIPDDDAGGETAGGSGKQEINFATVTLYSDTPDSYVTIQNVSNTIAKNKRSKQSVDTVVQYLKIPQTVAQNIKFVLKEPLIK
jgi:hypothetical protein